MVLIQFPLSVLWHVCTTGWRSHASLGRLSAAQNLVQLGVNNLVREREPSWLLLGMDKPFPASILINAELLTSVFVIYLDTYLFASVYVVR